MNVYKAVRDNMAVFLNPDKFDEFLNRGYLIYKVQDLENENLDKLLSADEIETLKNGDTGQSFIMQKGVDEIDDNTSEP